MWVCVYGRHLKWRRIVVASCCALVAKPGKKRNTRMLGNKGELVLYINIFDLYFLFNNYEELS